MSDAPHHRTDLASIDIDAAPEQIYAAFEDPSKLMEWLPPTGMTGRAIEYDFREGGSYRIELSYGEAAPAGIGKTEERKDVSAGRFLSLEPGRRIVQTVEFESSDARFAGEMQMSWSFESTSPGTRVTVMATNVPPGIGAADHEEGLRSSLENLAAFMKRRSVRTVDGWKEILRIAIREAMRSRDKEALAAGRETLAAIDNAEAKEIDAGPAAQEGPIAGAVAGAGAGDVARRILSPEEVAAIVRTEIGAREDAARVFAELGRTNEAERLRRQAAFLSSL